MAPLSKELSGVIFDHVHCGNHLNSKKETVDIELEKKTIEYAGQALAALWNSMPNNERGVGGYDVDFSLGGSGWLRGGGGHPLFLHKNGGLPTCSVLII